MGAAAGRVVDSNARRMNEDISLKSNLIVTDDVELNIIRLDLIDPLIGGNKWFKLKYNIGKARDEGFNTLLTFGGAYSNHIYAAAAAGKRYSFHTIGIIRGEEHLPLNPTLKFASENGMELHYISRSEYRRRYDPDFIEKLIQKYGRVFVLPEGGTNIEAVKGCSEIPTLIKTDYDLICTPCGTGGTAAGLICGVSPSKRVLAFSVLKGGDFLRANIQKLLDAYNKDDAGRELSDDRSNEGVEAGGGWSGASNWDVVTNYHFGGYAKVNKELADFILWFENKHDIPLDPVYTGKMLFGIYDLIRKGYFSPGTKVAVLHTGGLQGRVSLQERLNGLSEE